MSDDEKLKELDKIQSEAWEDLNEPNISEQTQGYLYNRLTHVLMAKQVIYKRQLEQLKKQIR